MLIASRGIRFLFLFHLPLSPSMFRVCHPWWASRSSGTNIEEGISCDTGAIWGIDTSCWPKNWRIVNAWEQAWRQEKGHPADELEFETSDHQSIWRAETKTWYKRARSSLKVGWLGFEKPIWSRIVCSIGKGTECKSPGNWKSYPDPKIKRRWRLTYFILCWKVRSSEWSDNGWKWYPITAGCQRSIWIKRIGKPVSDVRVPPWCRDHSTEYVNAELW